MRGRHIHYFCGCYYVCGPAPYHGALPPVRWLPQVAVSAHTTILSTTSRTVLTQTFSNPSSADAIPEATYTFPLYDGVGVVGFNCRIGKRIIRGVVKEKAKAKAVYEQAVARGETAGLLEQLLESSDVFTTKIGNIPAGEEVVVEITYFGELKHDAEADGIRFTIPTTIIPRYGELPGGIIEPGSNSKSRRATESSGIQITVDVALPPQSNIRGIQSPSHPIAVTMGGITAGSKGSEFEPNKGAATLSLGKAELDNDFVLLVMVPDIVKPQALLEIHPTISNQRALMVTLVPKFSLPPQKPEVVFIVDRSGSMSSNIPTLISALKVFLKSIPLGVKFNICSFGSSYSMLWKRSQTYDQTTLKSAIEHVEKFGADMGGTEMFAPVKAVIENRQDGMALEVMLLTDGEIWNQQELFSYLNKEVQQSEAPIRIFTLGIGNGVSHSLIEGIARAGNGFSQAVGLDEKLDGKVVRMLKGALSPHIRDYHLEVKYGSDGDEDTDEAIDRVAEGLRIVDLDPKSSSASENPQKISLFDEDVDMDREPTPVADTDGTVEKYTHLPEVPRPKLLQVPSHIPPLFPFSRTVIYLLMSPQSNQRLPTSVLLKGSFGNVPLELEIPVQVLEDKAETIHQLAARKAVGELEEGRGWIFDAKDEGGVPIKERFEGRWGDIVEREGVRLGVEFQVGGKWCSFVAVEANDAELAEKEKARIKAAERREHEKVLIEEDALDMNFQSFTGGGGPYPPASTLDDDDTSSIATSAISTGTFVSTSTAASVNKPFQGDSGQINDSRIRRRDILGGRLGSGMRAHTRGRGRGGISSRTILNNDSEHAGPPTEYSPERSRLTAAPQSSPVYLSAIEPKSFAAPPPPPLAGGPAFGQACLPPGMTHHYIPQAASPAPQPKGRLPTSPPGSVGSTSPDGATLHMSEEKSEKAKKRSKPAFFKLRTLKASQGTSPKVYEHDEGDEMDIPSNPTPKPTNPTETLHALIALQSFAGSWALTSGLCDLLGVTLSNAQAKVQDKKLWDVWATILVVVYLEQKLANEEETWDLVVGKARDWVKGEKVTVEGGLEGLERLAKELLEI
jgi:Vault protein inter-alpha-trypsin domain/von Willebrand factor type A domain